jgi:hypothetical protein
MNPNFPGNHGGYMDEAMTTNVDGRLVESFVTIINSFLSVTG